jgi:hypothetical protein
MEANMGIARASVFEAIEHLPPEARREVEDFVSFLSLRYANAAKPSGGKTSSRTAARFVGMWRNREDLRDSSAWVQRTRRQEW